MFFIYNMMYQDINSIIELYLIPQVTKLLVICRKLLQSVKEFTPSDSVHLRIGNWSSATGFRLTRYEWILSEAASLSYLGDDNIIPFVLIDVDK